MSAECNECGVRPSARGFDAAKNSECGTPGDTMIFEKAEVRGQKEGSGPLTIWVAFSGCTLAEMTERNTKEQKGTVRNNIFSPFFSVPTGVCKGRGMTGRGIKSGDRQIG